MDKAFKALASTPRRRILNHLAGGPMTVEEPVVEEEPDMMMELDEEVIRMTDTAERPAYRPGMRPGMPGFPKPPERPVPLQRRESAGARDQRVDGTRESERQDCPRYEGCSVGTHASGVLFGKAVSSF